MEKAVIYVRVSSKEQEAEGFSIPSQIKFLKEEAILRKYQIVKEFIDIETAKKSGRTQFNEMIKFIKTNKGINHILVEKTDRLLRNISDYALIDGLMEQSHFNVHLVKENSVLSRDSRSHEKLVFGFKVILAKNHSDNLSEETRKGMTEKAEQGIYPSCAPYGYINTQEGDRKIIKPDSSSAHYVKKMFELYATGNYSLLSLKKKMLADGMVYRNGKNFYKHAVEVILKNEFYTGVFFWKGKKYEDAQHEPLISKELFREVQSILRNPKKYKSRKDLFSFTNLISCGVCGFSITAQIQKKKYIYYHCGGYKQNCGQPYVREENIEEQIVHVLEQLHVPEEMEAMILEGLQESMHEKLEYEETARSNMEHQIKVLQNRIERAYQDKLDGKIGEEFWLRQNNKWLLDKENLTAQLEAQSHSDLSYLKNTRLILELARNAVKLFKNARTEQKQKFANQLFSNCLLKDGKLDLELKEVYEILREGGRTGNWRPQWDLNPCFCRERAMS